MIKTITIYLFKHIWLKFPINLELLKNWDVMKIRQVRTHILSHKWNKNNGMKYNELFWLNEYWWTDLFLSIILSLRLFRFNGWVNKSCHCSPGQMGWQGVHPQYNNNSIKWFQNIYFQIQNVQIVIGGPGPVLSSQPVVLGVFWEAKAKPLFGLNRLARESRPLAWCNTWLNISI